MQDTEKSARMAGVHCFTYLKHEKKSKWDPLPRESSSVPLPLAVHSLHLLGG